jgi:hypothetical protein
VSFLLHLRTETDPVSETSCFLVFRIQDDGQSTNAAIPRKELAVSVRTWNEMKLFFYFCYDFVYLDVQNLCPKKLNCIYN